MADRGIFDGKLSGIFDPAIFDTDFDNFPVGKDINLNVNLEISDVDLNIGTTSVSANTNLTDISTVAVED